VIKEQSYKKISVFFFAILLTLVGLYKIFLYGDFAPSVILQTEAVSQQSNVFLNSSKKITQRFKANHDRLGIISVYFKIDKKNNTDSQIIFRVRRLGEKKWHYSNVYKVSRMVSDQYYPFGFPLIEKSAGETIEFQIELIAGNKASEIMVEKNKPFFVKYHFPFAYLKANKHAIPSYILNKIVSLTNKVTILDFLCIITLSLILYCVLEFHLVKRVHFFGRFLYKKYLFFKKNIILPDRFVLIMIFISLFLINFLVNNVNRYIPLSFSDDLYLWDCYMISKNHPFDFIFSVAANKFRPVSNCILFVILKIFENRIHLLGFINLTVNYFIAITLFLIILKISKNKALSFMLSTVYIFSEFSYYIITQLLGLMEAVSLLFSLLMVYFFWKYLNTKSREYFWFSLIFFVFAIFSHERFMILGVLYILILFERKINLKKILLVAIGMLPVAINLILMKYFFKVRMFDGTGGTNTIETFNLTQFFTFFKSSWFYLFGANDGPAYLSGIHYLDAPVYIINLIYVNFVLFLAFIFLLILFLIKLKKPVRSKKIILNSSIFLLFIVSLLFIASVTIRVEMRWIYAPFVGLLLLIGYLYGEVKCTKRYQKIIFALIFIWATITTGINIFYRSYYRNIYCFGPLITGNSLYANTINKYKNEFWNYDVYVVCQNCDQQTFDYISYLNKHFFYQFKPTKELKIQTVKNTDRIKKDKKNLSIILFYDSKNNKFTEK